MEKHSFIFIMPPSKADAESIRDIMHEYAIKGIILERSVEDIRDSINSFLVAKKDNKIIGIIARYDYGQKLIEIRSLAVKSSYAGYKIGTRLLEAMVNIIRQEDGYKIFSLSYAPEFFKKNGFIEVPKGSLPEKIWKDCINCKDKENCGETALMFSQSKIKSRG